MSDADARHRLFPALGRLPSGLFIVTVRNGVAETGMLASWVQQCSFEPPQLSVALKPGREVSQWLVDGASFTVNVLEESQTEFVAHFGRGFGPNEPAFTGLALDRPNDAAPVLTEALAYLDCRVANRFAAGDHDLVIGTIVAGAVLQDGRPMIHVRKSGSHY